MGDAGFEVSLEGWVLSRLTGIDGARGTGVERSPGGVRGVEPQRGKHQDALAEAASSSRLNFRLKI